MINQYDRATREPSRVALVTCADLPDLDPDDRLLADALSSRGLPVIPAVWSSTTVDWSSFSVAVLRSTWDYPGRRDEFVAWAGRVPRLANPASVVAWNTDKRYLRELAAAGVPVVPTSWISPGDRFRPDASGEIVVKPTISAGGVDTGRYDLSDADHRAAALAHLARLGAAGRVAMVQPYLETVDTVGETALLFLADPGGNGLTYSHAIRKGPLLTGPDAGVDGLYRVEEITPRTPSAAELSVARLALHALPAAWSASLLYARVDLIPGPDGAPLVVELELTEPSLFLSTSPGAADRFAAAIAARVAAAPG